MGVANSNSSDWKKHDAQTGGGPLFFFVFLSITPSFSRDTPFERKAARTQLIKSKDYEHTPMGKTHRA